MFRSLPDALQDQFAPTTILWQAGSTGNPNGPLIPIRGYSQIAILNTSNVATVSNLGLTLSNDGINFTSVIIGAFYTPAGVSTTLISPQSIVFAQVGGATWARISGNGDASNNATLIAVSGEGLRPLQFDTSGNLDVTIRSFGGTTGANVSNPNTDSVSSGQGALAVRALEHRWAGAVWERLRSNIPSVMITGTFTTAQDSALITNQNWTKVRIILDVTVASGTGGLTVRLQGQDSASTHFYNINVAPPAVTTISTTAYDIFPGAVAPGAGSGIVQATNAAIPRTYKIHVDVGDATSYTYTVSHEGLT